MSKSRKTRFYAVRVGRQGPRIYSSWEEAKKNIYKYPGALQKSFLTLCDAERWLNIASDSLHVPGLPLDWQLRLELAPRTKQRHKVERATSTADRFNLNSRPLEMKGESIDMEYQDPDMMHPMTKTEESEPFTSHVKAEDVAKAPGLSERLNVIQQYLRRPGEGPPLLQSKVQDTASPTSTAKTEDVLPKLEEPPVCPRHPQRAGPPPPPVILSDEQQSIVDMVLSGRNVFFTGSAGTGKSVLLREIIKHCGGHQSELLAITAATGIASVNIGGCTLHSWAGIGLGKEPAEKLVGKFFGQDRNGREREVRGEVTDEGIRTPLPYRESYSSTVKRWREVRTLIIDEISMIDGVLFDKLEYIARRLRYDSDKPFGGIQLVLCGDFCQLPPVPDHDRHNVPIPAVFAFEARSWSKCIGKPILLRHVFRQSDQKFVDMLNSMRLGKLTPSITAEFRGLSRRVIYKDGIEPTDLFPTRREVENANISRLNRLNAPRHVYTATDKPGVDENGEKYPFRRVKPALERLIAPREITLKVGAQVMLVKNLVQGQLVNGSLGRVVDFSTPCSARQCGTDIAKEEQYEKSHKKPDNQHVLKEAERYIWPIVKFANGRELLCVPATFEAISVDGSIEATRYQVPLILAWALSIHKSQGQTLERVRVDLGRVFEKGQAYVALSRATSLDALEVYGFQPLKVQAHPRVIQWMHDVMTSDVESELKMESEMDDDRQYWDALEE